MRAGVAFNDMERVEQTVSALIELGERHDGYGAEPDPHPVVGEVPIDPPEAGLGDDFGDEAEVAWARTYSTLASVMLSR
jgi:hemoglobin-like flavoprotein